MHAKFDSFAYSRPNLQFVRTNFEQLLLAIQSAATADIQIEYISKMLALREEFSTMYNLCYIRHTANTKDPFYDGENNFFDQAMPDYEALNNQLQEAMLTSSFRPQLEVHFGKQIFTLAELSTKTFQPTILEDLKEENKLSSQYTQIKSSAQIAFEGKTYNLSSIHPIELSDDRSVRRSATLAKWRFFEENQSKIEDIYDQMVKTRTTIAHKLGHKNFIETGYARMRRSDYCPEMVQVFRKQVRELIVPLATKLYERQRQRLGIDKIRWYDEDYKFATGNPKPIGTPEKIIENAGRMYEELSSETHAFFQYMRNTQLMDLVNRDAKAPGGYCTYLMRFKAPFIYSNFNGTSGDIDVLTHEAGHAFQVWSSGQLFNLEEYQWPTSDAAEIHSMSMEFFTWPWMPLFFGDQTDKYYFMHLAGGIQFLPYGVAVDEFQHIIYEQPDLTPAERNTVWRDLERIYLPHRDYEGHEFLESGGAWQRQSHIFNSPFYYIDYTLAQICAFQFWSKDRSEHETAWNDYLRLCKAGGSQSFLDLVQLANLRSPFEPGCVSSVIGKIEAYLDSLDDSKW